MRSTIKFYAKFILRAIKVQYIISHRELASPSCSLQITRFKTHPQHRFGRS